MKILLSVLFIFGYFSLHAQQKKSLNRPDHTVFIEKLRNSENVSYQYYLSVFDNYLRINPNDVSIWIEKCKFIANAQYDNEEEYNPNQEVFDSLLTEMYDKFPDDPNVVLYKIANTWGDEKIELVRELESDIDERNNWTNTDRSKIYFECAQIEYDSSKYVAAKAYILEAIHYNMAYEYDLLYAKILIELGDNGSAKEVLLDTRDTTRDLTILSEKAKLLMLIKEYSSAISVYDTIVAINPEFVNNQELAKAMEGVKKYELARNFLIAECKKPWMKESAQLSLFLHDLRFQKGSLALSSYNDYRDDGYYRDPLAIYRLKLFFRHPLLLWHFRDLLGLFSLMLLLIALMVIPYFWVLPVYAAGKKFKNLNSLVPEKLDWSLKAFWFISFVYLFANFLALSVEPEALKKILFFTFSPVDVSDETCAFIDLVFMFTLGTLTLFTLRKKTLTIFAPGSWTLKKYTGTILGYFLLFKFGTRIYLLLGSSFFDISDYEFKSTLNIILNAAVEIKNMLKVYGFGVTLLMVGVIAPVYEEIIFRGVVLHSSQKYIGYHLANIFQAFLFALIHQDLFLMPVLFAFGYICGFLTRKSASLLPGIIFHVINNSLIIILMKALAK